MIPVDVDRDEAREAAERELADPIYQAAEPSLVDRIATWIGELLVDVLTGVVSLSAGPAGLVVVAVLVAAVAAIVRWRVGRIARSARGRGRAPLFEGRPLTAADHRLAAESAAARGDLAEAVRERFRAMARELEQRGVLDELTGRTVDEIAAAAGRALPGSAGDLRNAALIFDDVVYGARPATVDNYGHLAALDDRLRTERVGASR